MSRTYRILLSLSAGLGSVPAAAQESTGDGFSLSGTSRLRFESVEGQPRVGFNRSDTMVSLRTAVLAEWRRGPVRVVGEVRDSRVYGDNGGTPITTNEVNAVEPVQAFVELQAANPFGAGGSATVQAGRILLNLGSRRLVATNEYRNTTNAFTGIRTDLLWRGGWKATLLYVLPQQRRPDSAADLRRNAVALDREGFDQVLWGGMVTRQRAPGAMRVETAFFHLGERDTPGRATLNRSLNTATLRLLAEPAPGRDDLDIEGGIQRGHIAADLAATAPTLKVAAWFFHAAAGHGFTGGAKLRVAVVFDAASGDRPGGRYGRFDTLFGMRRSDLAPSGLYGAVGRSNVVSPGVQIEAAPGTRTDMMATLRPLWLAARQDGFSTTGVRDASGRSGSFAGTQADLRIRHTLREGLRAEADIVLLDKGAFLRHAPNALRGRWTRYAALNLTATF